MSASVQIRYVQSNTGEALFLYQEENSTNWVLQAADAPADAEPVSMFNSRDDAELSLRKMGCVRVSE